MALDTKETNIPFNQNCMKDTKKNDVIIQKINYLLLPKL